MTSCASRERVIRWDDPRIAATALKSRSGLQYLQQLQAGALPMPSMYVVMNIEFTQVAYGRLELAGVPGEEHCNMLGFIHGGFIMAVLDSAMGCAAISTLEKGGWFTTISFASNFVRALEPNSATARCVAEVLHRGQRTISSRARLFDAKGKLCAHATSSCLVAPVPTWIKRATRERVERKTSIPD